MIDQATALRWLFWLGGTGALCLPGPGCYGRYGARPRRDDKSETDRCPDMTAIRMR